MLPKTGRLIEGSLVQAVSVLYGGEVQAAAASLHSDSMNHSNKKHYKRMAHVGK
jgi:hypothetical protein